MALAPGFRLGAYEVTALLGEGGMGQVYRARDTKLNRDVALKVLPDSFASDQDRLARFTREARTLASLNHPHIAAIYGLEESGAVRALVMEFVEGEDLSQRITRGAIPIDEALPIATQIADALEAAHDQGIIHRDLKPANIKVRADGKVKVLDFGLAKVMEPPASSPNVTQSPTITTPAMTQAGMILGTAAYMSPEQAKGRPADKRSDVWAFGCVLYEMLSGKRAFSGEDVADTLAMVLKGEIDIGALPSSVPSAIRELIRACLRKDRNERIGDIAAALFVLRQRPDVAEATGRPQRPFWFLATPVIAALVIGAAISAAVFWRPDSKAAPLVTRFALMLPQDQQLTVNRRAVALSPDGTRIVYAANGGLFLRLLSEFEATAIAGTNPGIAPAFSPDGQSLVFWADSAIKKIAIGGGSAVTLCTASSAPTNLFWTNGYILFSDGGTAIKRVSQNGGKPETLVDLNSSEDLAFNPQLLPDGDTLLFAVLPRTNANLDRWDRAQIVAQSLKTGVRKALIDGADDAQYVPTGHIVYISGGSLFAVPFNLQTLTVTGGALPVVEGIRLGATSGVGRSAHYAFSSSGSLAYVPGPASAAQQDLMLFDRSGAAEALKLLPGDYQYPRVSRDGTRIAYGAIAGKESAIWIYDVSRRSAARRLTFEGNNRFPVWSADGTHVAFQSDREGDLALFWQPVDGGPAERLTKPDAGTAHVPETWSPVQDTLLFSATRDFVSSLWTLSVKDRTTAPFDGVKSSSLPTDAVFSPDGHWVAYQVGQPGSTTEGITYVQPFPPTGDLREVGRGGRPLWSHDGKELFFVPAPGQLVVVGVRTEPSLSFTNPVPVPRGFGEANPSRPRTFDLLDGRFVAVGTPGQSATSGIAASQVRVVVNWFTELKAKVPTQ